MEVKENPIRSSIKIQARTPHIIYKTADLLGFPHTTKAIGSSGAKSFPAPPCGWQIICMLNLASKSEWNEIILFALTLNLAQTKTNQYHYFQNL